MRRLRALVALLLVATTGLAHAGTLSCSRVWEQRNSNLFKVVAIGSCSMSTSYATGGDVFAGASTPVNNAGQVLCGQDYDVPVFVSMNAEAGTFQLLFGYDYTNHTVVAYTPTHSAGTSTGTITSLNGVTVTGGSSPTATFVGFPTTPAGHLSSTAVTLAGALNGTNTQPTFGGTPAAVSGTNGAVSCSLPNDGLTPDGNVTFKSGAWSYSSAAGSTQVLTGCAAPSFTGNNFTPAGIVTTPAWSSDWPSAASAVVASNALTMDNFNPVGTIAVDPLVLGLDAGSVSGNVTLPARDQDPAEEVPATLNLASFPVRFRYLAYCN